VPPIALFLAWQERDRLRDAPSRPSALGLVLLAVSLGLYVIGSLGAELFVTRVSLIGVVAGTVALRLRMEPSPPRRLPLAFSSS